MRGSFERREAALERIISCSIITPRKELGFNYVDVQRLLAVPLWGVSSTSVEAVKKLESAYEILRTANYARTSHRDEAKVKFTEVCQHLADYMAFLGRTNKQRKEFFDELREVAPNTVYCDSTVQTYKPEEVKKSRVQIRLGGNHHRMVYAG
jgi:hypothetical protein